MLQIRIIPPRFFHYRASLQSYESWKQMLRPRLNERWDFFHENSSRIRKVIHDIKIDIFREIWQNLSIAGIAKMVTNEHHDFSHNQYKIKPRRCGRVQCFKICDEVRILPQTACEKVIWSQRIRVSNIRIHSERFCNYSSPLPSDESLKQLLWSTQTKRQNFCHEIPA